MADRHVVPTNIVLGAILVTLLFVRGAGAAGTLERVAAPPDASPTATRHPGTTAPSTTATSSTAPASTAVPAPTTQGVPPGSTELPSGPIRAAFYYPWFPEAWEQGGVDPFTRFAPSAGLYDSSVDSVIDGHLAAMRWGHIDAALASWWGLDTPTDLRLTKLLDRSVGSGIWWAPYVEQEGYGDPSVAEIDADITALLDRFDSHPQALLLDGRLVVFVYADPDDGCAMVDRWTSANAGRVHLVLKVFSGYEACAQQPDAWHQYAPANASDAQLPWSYTVSPGFWLAEPGAPERLARAADRFRADVQSMVGSGAQFQLVTTFNEWGEGTSVESAGEWASDSGFGVYLDILHDIPTR